MNRDEERGLLTSLLDSAPERGRALIFHGAPGIGKSRLILDTQSRARQRGMTVLAAVGVQSEAHLPFAGLHQLLRPVRDRAGDLRGVQQAALDAAFGLTHDTPPEHFVIALAVLDLLSDVATDSPLLVVVDDAHWLDRATADVLAFVARRIESDPIVLLAALRDGYPSPLIGAGLPEYHVGALDAATAAELLDTTAPSLANGPRLRVLREAAGNPLAILELPAAVSAPTDDLWPSVGVPLTERLERAFADRVSYLPDTTRMLLLVAALSDEDRLDEILEASTSLVGTRMDLDVVWPAAEAGIVHADLHTIRFRHPLMRSAVTQTAGLEARRRAHTALADALHDQPHRRAWHRAALLSGEHEDIALELEEAAARARRQGAVLVSVAALRRAAELGGAPARGRRLLTAADLALEIGRRDLVAPLLQEVGELRLDELDRARVTFVEETAMTRPLDAERFASLIATAERAGADGDHDLHVDLLWLVASRAWWVDPGPDVRRTLIEASNRLGDATAEDPRVFAVHAYADPLGHAAGVLQRLQRESRVDRVDADAACFFGPAALVVGAFDLGADFLAAGVSGLRSQGRLRHLPRLLMLYAVTAARIGDWGVAVTAADEARRLANEFNDPQAAAAADTADSLVAAMRGDEQTAEAMAARAEGVAAPVGANITMAFAQFGKVLAALAGSRYADAYTHADRLFQPGDSAYHPVIAFWGIADLADAARHIGQVPAARVRVAQVEAMCREPRGTWIELGLRYARAVVAEPDEADERFADALASDFTRWPFQRARLQLAHGQWLRAERRLDDSRVALRAARETFDFLGCVPWGDLARRELRASGETSRGRTPDVRERLTPQELQIAQFAATGLSNREIGEQLYLSHRTVSTHLYHVFPKLGITSRAELNAALAPAPAADDA